MPATDDANVKQPTTRRGSDGGVGGAGLLLAIGVALAGWFIGDGFVAGRRADNIVTVKGLAEREVKADLALWPLRFVATNDNLAVAQGKIAADTAVVTRFVTEAGIDPASVQTEPLEVTDRLAERYRSGPVESRFIVAQTVMVRSTDVDRIDALARRLGDLVAAGVVLTTEGQPYPGPLYLFTGLNDIKPSMIGEATVNARDGAEKFAADSGSQIAGIRRAAQGVFQILPRDNAPGVIEERQILKTVRVVSTIEYLLED